MAKRLKIPWQEDEATLLRLYRNEPEPELRLRWHALWLLRRGYPVAEVVTTLGICERSVRRWIAWYRAGGIAELRRRRRGGRQGRPPRLSRAQQEQLKAQAAAGQFRTIHDAVAWVQERFGVSYTYWGMRSLFVRLRLRKKLPRAVAAKAEVQQQTAWKKGGLSKPFGQAG